MVSETEQQQKRKFQMVKDLLLSIWRTALSMQMSQSNDAMHRHVSRDVYTSTKIYLYSINKYDRSGARFQWLAKLSPNGLVMAPRVPLHRSIRNHLLKKPISAAYMYVYILCQYKRIQQRSRRIGRKLDRTQSIVYTYIYLFKRRRAIAITRVLYCAGVRLDYSICGFSGCRLRQRDDSDCRWRVEGAIVEANGRGSSL